MNAPAKTVSKAERLGHFRNLAVLALNDGRVQPAERALLNFVARRWGLPWEDVRNVMYDLRDTPFVVPPGKEGRFQQLYDLTELIIIDAVVLPQERHLCHALAMRLGFERSDVTRIIEGIVSGNRAGLDEETIRENVWQKVQGEYAKVPV